MSRFTQRLTYAWHALTSRNLSSLAARFARGEDGGGDGGAVLRSPYQQCAWVYAAVSAVARQMAGVEFRISRGTRGGDDLVGDGPVVDLFADPHPQLDRYRWLETLVSWLLLEGDAFAVAIDRSGRAIPIRRRLGRVAPDKVLLLSPAQMREVVSSDGLEGWAYHGHFRDGIGRMELLPEEVLQLAFTNPFDPIRGMAPLRAALVAAQSDYATAMFQRGLMMNNADTGLTVSTDQWLNDEQREQILAALRERKRKAGTADRPLILGGGLKLERPTIPLADIQALEHRKFSRQEILAVFGVPQEILGFSEDANRSVSESARLSFIEHTCIPLGDRLEAMLAPVVRSFGEDLVGWFDWDALPIFAAARRARADTATKLFGLGIPLNDIVEQLDLGFPRYEWGNVGYLPFSLAPAGEPPQLPPEPGSPAATEDPQDNAFLRLAKTLSAAPAPAHQCGPPTGWERSIAASVRRKASRLRRFFFGQRARILEALQAAAQRGVAGRTKGIVDEIFDLLAENDRLEKDVQPLIIADLEFGAAQLAAEVGGVTFELSPARIGEYLANRAGIIQGINQTTFEALRTSLEEGIATGESFADLADRVRQIYTDASRSRAETIAHTETQVAINTGRYDAMTEAGVPLKGWLASNLETTRPEHTEAGRQYDEAGAIGVDDTFWVGGEELRFPGDPFGSPGNTINCRCTTFAVFEEEDERGVTRRRACLPAKVLSYDTWLETRQKAAGRSGGSGDTPPTPPTAGTPVSDGLQDHSKSHPAPGKTPATPPTP